MKKFITILAVAAVSLNFVSCRQDDDSTALSSTENKMTASNKIVKDTVKTDSVKSGHKEAPVDPDPPVKDGTSW